MVSYSKRRFCRNLLAIVLIAALSGAVSYTSVWLCGELGKIGRLVQPAGGFSSASSSEEISDHTTALMPEFSQAD